jgi:hypothetical protein
MEQNIVFYIALTRYLFMALAAFERSKINVAGLNGEKCKCSFNMGKLSLNVFFLLWVARELSFILFQIYKFES